MSGLPETRSIVLQNQIFLELQLNLSLLCFFEISYMFALAMFAEVCVDFIIFHEPVGIKKKGKRSKYRLMQN